MEKFDLVYLLVAFPDAGSLSRAVQSLRVPRERISLVGGDGNGAGSLGLSSSLLNDVSLTEGQQQRLDWHLKNGNRPILAVAIEAVDGRDMRHQLQQLGGELIDAPSVGEQINDAVIEPGMISPEPQLPLDNEMAWKSRDGAP